MKNTKRILSIALAALLLVGTLAGCSMPKLTLGGTGNVAATVAGKDIPTGEYLAYLYNNFYNMYFGQGLYQYAQYYDVWDQSFTYGEGDDAQSVKLDEYITLLTKECIVRQEALTQLMEKYNVKWNEEDAKKVEEDLASLTEDSYLSLGFSNEHFITAYKALNLNESSLFYGLYGEGGQREMNEEARRTYFNENYLSYKSISIDLTGEDGEELDEAGKKAVLDQLNGYLATYNTNKNFEAIVDAYNKSIAAEGEEVTPSTDEGNRVNMDFGANADDPLALKVKDSVTVGQASVVEYTTANATPAAALVLRLDINEPATLFTDETKNIIYNAKYEEYDKEVRELADSLEASFNKSVIGKCSSKKFVE